MPLRGLAASELDSLRRSAADRAGQAQRDLEALRVTVDTAVAALGKALAAASPGEAEIAGVLEKIDAAATAEVERATARIREEGDRALADAVAAARAESQRALEQALAAARAESDRALETALQAARAESERAVAAAVETTRANLDSQLEAERATSAALVRARDEANRALADARDEGERAAQELKSARAGHDALTQELASARTELAGTAQQLAAVQQSLDASQAAAAAATAEADRRVHDLQLALIKAEVARAEQVRAVRDRTVKLALEPIEHLRAAFQRLTGAKTTDDVLMILLEALGTEFSRVALFDVTANCIEGRRHIGFDAEGGISKILVPLNVQSPLTNAVRSGRVQGLPARELTDPAHVLFGGDPSFVLALPVAVRGRAIAVIYADDCDQADAEFVTPERRVKFAEVLLWHAVPLLTRFAIEAEATAEIREYAASVVRDLESVYAVDATTHKGADLRARLQQNLEYARKRFDERVESEDPAAASLLEDEIARVVSGKGSTAFARDLATAAGIAPRPEAAKPAKSGTSQRA